MKLKVRYREHPEYHVKQVVGYSCCPNTARFCKSDEVIVHASNIDLTEFFRNWKDYVVEDGQVVLSDVLFTKHSK